MPPQTSFYKKYNLGGVKPSPVLYIGVEAGRHLISKVIMLPKYFFVKL